MTASTQTPRTPEDKLAAYRAAMEWDAAAQFRATVYAHLMRAMMDEFGEQVLDIAERFRRESGQYCGELGVDIAANERKYDQDPAILIREMDEMWHSMAGDWARTCICAYRANPDLRRHELYCVRCTYAEAFRAAGEERIGITWCCWDMGYTPTFHPLFCQYMPKHMLKGDGVCYQIRRLADTPEQQAELNSIEHTGWRSWGKPVGGPADAESKGVELHRALLNDLPPAERLRAGSQGFMASMRNADGYYALVQDIAAEHGQKTYEIAEKAFAADGMEFDPEAMRTPGLVRRIGYAMDGLNVYEVELRPHEPSMAQVICRVYNHEMRKVSRDAIMTSDELARCLPGSGAGTADLAAVVFNKWNQALGFIHCRTLASGQGSVEALAFLPGRLHEHVGACLRDAAAGFFRQRRIRQVQLLAGTTGYAFYRFTPNPLERIKAALPHVHNVLVQTWGSGE